MRLSRKWLLFGVIIGLVAAGVAYAQTVNQILNSVYDSSNTALRINQVAGS